MKTLDDALAKAKIQPWAGKSFEGVPAGEYLRKLRIDPSIWPWLWGEVDYIAKVYKPKPRALSPEREKAIAGMLSRSLQPRKPSPTRSRQARAFRQAAARLRKVNLTAEAASHDEVALCLTEEARRRKHRGMGESNYRLLRLMADIQSLTGRWHDLELAGLLGCAKYPETLAQPEVLRIRRNKYLKPRSNQP
jgi:hypothetical protein